MGMNLSTLSCSVDRHLQALLKSEMPQNQKDWKVEGLFDFSYRILFKYDQTPAAHTLLAMPEEVHLCRKSSAKQFTLKSILRFSVCKHSEKNLECLFKGSFHVEVSG